MMKKISRKTLNRSFLNWFYGNLTCFSQEHMQTFGYLCSMLPIVNELYEKAEERKKAMSTYSAFFNTEPQVGALVVGMTAGLEEARAKTENEDRAKNAAVNQLKSAEAEKLKRIRAARELVRVRITCMNPLKKEYEGEFFSVGNSEIPTITKFVQFEREYHVPRIMLNMIRNKKYQMFVEERTPNGGKIKRGKLVREYAIEELPPLTANELQELKQRQLMAQGSAQN